PRKRRPASSPWSEHAFARKSCAGATGPASRSAWRCRPPPATGRRSRPPTAAVGSWFDHLAAQEELGQCGGAREAEQRDEQRHVEIQSRFEPQAKDQKDQHAVDVNRIERENPVLCRRAAQQPENRASQPQY